MAAGVEQGDIVVTVPHTFIATTEAISQAGAQSISWTSTKPLTPWIPEKLREYLETRCEFDGKANKLSTARVASA